MVLGGEFIEEPLSYLHHHRATFCVSAFHDSSADFSVTSTSPAVPMPELVGPTPTASATDVSGLAVLVRPSSRHPEVRALSLRSHRHLVNHRLPWLLTMLTS